MSLVSSVSRYVAIVMFVVANQHVDAATFNLLLDGTVSRVGDLPISFNPSSFRPVEIGIQAFENFSLSVFNQLNPSTIVGVYQWSPDFAILNQNGSPISESDLSPFGTTLTGYGQNCGAIPFCPRAIR
jgi:hypothetical protein